jgi:predicted O-methyltransferase YrrM
MKTFYGLPSVRLELVVPGPTVVLPPIIDDICLPPYFGADDHDDYLPLMSLVRAFRPEVVLELGTAFGNTVANICHHLPDTKVYTVNAPAEEQTGRTTTFQLSRGEIGRVYRRYGFQRRVTQIFANTLNLDLATYFQAPVVDLAVIDACHDREYVLNDFAKVVCFMRKNGFILLHDTSPSMKNHLIGSYSACMALRRRGFDIRHLENTWWAMWTDWSRLALRHPSYSPTSIGSHPTMGSGKCIP